MDTGKNGILKGLYIKNSKNRRWFYGVTLIIFILSTFICIKAFLQPLQVEEKIQENMIEQNTVFDYKVEVVPNTLNPKGGIIPEQGIISAKIVKNILIDLNSQIIAQKDIEINGTIEPTYIITAENQWEREFATGVKTSLSNPKTMTHEIKQQISISVSEIMNFINQVEEDTSIYADHYFLNIKPNFKGQMLYQGSEIPLDTKAELQFSVKNRQIEAIGEKEFTLQTPIELSKNIPSSFNILGIYLPTILARIVFGIVLLLSLTSMLWMKIQSSKKKVDKVEEWRVIDKRYKDKIIKVWQGIDIQSRMVVIMESFKDLYHVAEEREQLILRVQTLENTIHYYVLDGDFAYYYSSKRMEKSKDYSVITEGV